MSGPEQSTGNPLADWVGDMIEHGLRCTDCDIRIEADMSRSVFADDRAFCEDCYPEQDPRDPCFGPPPTVPARKVTP